METIARRALSAAPAGGVVESLQIKLLAKELHLAQTVVSAALGELVSVGLVERIQGAIAVRGRPTISYQIASSVLSNLDGKQCNSAHHQRYLERLFSEADIPAQVLFKQSKGQSKREVTTKDGRPAPPGARGRLSICNRLLLGVLLDRADQFGVVRELSSLELKILTGLNSESLKNRLQRLLKVGLIRCYVPGCTSSLFLRKSKKMSSIYFLNLGHKGFGVKPSCVVMVHQLRSLSFSRYDKIDELFRAVRSSGSDRKLYQLDAPKSVVSLLNKEKNNVVKFLRVLFYQYASELLMRHWQELDGITPLDCKWLSERIEEDIQKPAAFGVDAAENEKSWQSAVSYLCTVIIEIARLYKQGFGSISGVSWETAEFSILPVLSIDGLESIALILKKPSEDFPLCTVKLGDRYGGGMQSEEYVAEAEISPRYQAELGLVTKKVGGRLLKRDL